MLYVSHNHLEISQVQIQYSCSSFWLRVSKHTTISKNQSRAMICYMLPSKSVKKASKLTWRICFISLLHTKCLTPPIVMPSITAIHGTLNVPNIEQIWCNKAMQLKFNLIIAKHVQLCVAMESIFNFKDNYIEIVKADNWIDRLKILHADCIVQNVFFSKKILLNTFVRLWLSVSNL